MNFSPNETHSLFFVFILLKISCWRIDSHRHKRKAFNPTHSPTPPSKHPFTLSQSKKCAFALLDGLEIHAKFILLFSLCCVSFCMQNSFLYEWNKGAGAAGIYLCIISTVIDTFCLKVSPTPPHLSQPFYYFFFNFSSRIWYITKQTSPSRWCGGKRRKALYL